jgi:hypothetical protein
MAEDTHDNLSGDFHDILMISEFHGNFPEIPIYKDVDIKELTGGEKSPVFVTLPIGKAGSLSGNGRYYDDAFIVELEKQVRENKPIGLMGHLSSEQRSFAFPAEAVHWVGTMRVNEYLLGKGFLPEGESRTRLQRYKATRKKIATSIDAKGEGIWDDKINAHRMIAETLRLNQIDIAPADRAGISDLSAVPLLTQEMAQQNGIIVVRPIVKERKMEEKETVIKELKSSDAALLPEEVRSAIIQEYAADIKKALGLDGDIVETVKKIRERDEERERQSVSSHIKEIATSGDKAIKVEDIREMVIDMVQSRNPKTVAEVDTFYAEVLEKDSVKKALERSVQETMGPNQSSPFQKQTSQKTTATGMKGAWFVLPEVKE